MEEEKEHMMTGLPRSGPEDKTQNRIQRKCSWCLNWCWDFMIVLAVVGTVSGMIGFDGNIALVICLLISLFAAPAAALLIRKNFKHSLGEWLFCIEFQGSGFGDLFLKRVIPGFKFQGCRIHDFSVVRFFAGCVFLVLSIVCFC